MTRKKREVISTTILLCGEGSNDEAWLKYLKSIFATRNCRVKICNGGGGSPTSIIRKMTHREEFNYYTHRYVLIDSDRPETEEALIKARKNNIAVIISEQCLEVELLKLCNVTGNVLKRVKEDSKKAKEEFAKIGKHDSKSYSKLFPKTLLLTERKKGNKWLDELIGVFEE